MRKAIDLVLFSVMLMTVAGYFVLCPLNEDSTWLIYSADKMLEGAELYVDVVETNPPLIVILTAIPVSIATLLSLPASASYIAFVLLLIVLSLLFSCHILKAASRFSEPALRIFFLALAFILTIATSGDFGEKEHLLMIFILPYLLMMMFRDQVALSARFVSAIALFASLGFNLKPHFFLYFVVAELIYLLFHKRFDRLVRIETVVISASAFVYLGIIHSFFPAFIHELLPIAADSYFDAFTHGLYSLIMYSGTMKLGVLFVIYVIVFAYRRDRYDLNMLLGLLAAMACVYLIQRKGWHYQILPLFMMTLWGLVYTTVLYVKKDHRKYVFWIFSLVMIPLTAGIIISNAQRESFPELEKILASLEEESTVLVLSSEMAMGQPLIVEHGHVWSSRFNALWMMQTVVSEDDPSVKRYMMNAIQEDLVKYRPRYIILPNGESGFRYYDYFVTEDQQIASVFNENYTKTMEGDYVVLKAKGSL